MKFDSLCAKEIKDNRSTKPHVLPIYPTSSFAFDNIDEGIEMFSGEKSGHKYSRYGNPTNDTVAKKIAQMEAFGLDMEAGAKLCSSGMAAISTLMLSFLKSGDKVLTQNDLYGGTNSFFVKMLQPLGIEIILTDLKNTDRVADILKKDAAIKMMYLETPANPTMACVDLEKLAEIAQQFNVKTAIDNTFATPYLQQPFQFGIDFIVHSTTKFLNGHGNSIAGIIVAKDKKHIQQGGAIWNSMSLLGTNCSPFEAWLLHNGLKTLALRMDRHCANALEIANRLEKHPKVSQVNYCDLMSHPDFDIAQKQMRGCGGMMSFELKGGMEAGLKFMNQIKMCTLAPTLGDVDTLILHPVSMSHRGIPSAQLKAVGITEGLIRLSIGIENVEDIWNDLDAAMRNF
jgi:methionine-gamma-lyase